MRETRAIRNAIRNRLVIRDQAPMRGRELLVYLILSALIALPAVFGLWQQNEFVRTRFVIESSRKEKLALQERYRCLRIEKGTLESLDRIAQEATRLGLAPRDPDAPSVIVAPAAGGSGSELASARSMSGLDPRLVTANLEKGAP